MSVYVFEHVFVNRKTSCVIVVAPTYAEAIQIVVNHYFESYTTPADKVSEEVLRERLTCTLIDTKTSGVKCVIK